MKIAVFDSGVGGLTVLRALQRLLPQEKYLYFADTANVPYGDLPPEKIVQIASKALAFLQKREVDVIVIACHTVSSLCLPMLQEESAVPVIGMVIPSRDALLQLPVGSRVAILGTTRTIQSGVYSRDFPHLQIFPVACPSLVPFIEEGIFSGKELELFARRDLAGIAEVPLDAVFLACTHYPLIQPVLQNILGSCGFIDGAGAVAATVAQVMTQRGEVPSLEIYATAEALLFQKRMEHILNSAAQTKLYKTW